MTSCNIDRNCKGHHRNSAWTQWQKRDIQTENWYVRSIFLAPRHCWSGLKIYFNLFNVVDNVWFGWKSAWIDNGYPESPKKPPIWWLHFSIQRQKSISKEVRKMNKRDKTSFGIYFRWRMLASSGEALISTYTFQLLQNAYILFKLHTIVDFYLLTMIAKKINIRVNYVRVWKACRAQWNFE